MKKIKYLVLFFILFIPFLVNASTIDSIDMNIVLDKMGTATVTETWKANVTNGTEGWHPYYNLGNSTIKVLKASMDGHEYTIQDYWYENSSLSEKAYKAGIYKPSSDETDIVFGITNYGYHTYQVVYTITNFVSNLADADIIYWQLFPYDFSAEPKNVTVKVSGYYEYPDTLDVWGYGMYGALCYVNDGAIYMNTEGKISSDQYLVLLAKFPQNTFETTSRYDYTFEHYHELAEKGATKYKDKSDSLFARIGKILTGLFYAAIFLIPTIIGLISASKPKYGYKNNKTINKKEVHNFREIPCHKDIYYANALISLNNFGYKEGNILGAIILKWVREDKISFKNEKKGIFNKDTSSIDMTKNNTFDKPKEEELFNLMRAASGDGILEAKELEKWCRKNYSKYLDLFKSILDNEISTLKSQNHIYPRQSKEECKAKNVMDDTIYKDSTELYGLKKFLDEFSRMQEKEVLEVKLWDEYLMFAYLFGIADKVAKQLKNLYPETIKELEEQGLDMNTIYFINHISTSSVSAASSARSAAENYSSGGGGFSSGGGGGGSFGGGGGGGGFR